MLTMEEYALTVQWMMLFKFIVVVSILTIPMLSGIALMGDTAGLSKRQRLYVVAVAVVCVVVGGFAFAQAGYCKGKLQYHDSKVWQVQQKETR